MYCLFEYFPRSSYPAGFKKKQIEKHERKHEKYRKKSRKITEKNKKTHMKIKILWENTHVFFISYALFRVIYLSFVLILKLNTGN